jgi:hypothetical protein
MGMRSAIASIRSMLIAAMLRFLAPHPADVTNSLPGRVGTTVIPAHNAS